MIEADQPLNPYAPPAAIDPIAEVQLLDAWREGERLVVRAGAKLPPFCMVSGGPALYKHPISQIWQPDWVYLLLIFAVFPYFLVSPFLYRRVELLVPFGKSVYRAHQRWVNFGIAMMVVGGLLIAVFIAFALGIWLHWLSRPEAVMLVLGVLLFLIGLQVTSRQPMHLKIAKVELDLIYIDNVHPNYLARMPTVLEFAFVDRT